MNSVKPWLDKVGKFSVEHVPCPHFSQAVNLSEARKGVIHTTEGGSVDGAMGVFKSHYAPQFLVGPGRILQLVQVGTIGAALVTHNFDTLVQVEVVGFSKTSLWLPDPEVLEPLAALMALCQTEYSIPLFHPWPDGDYGANGSHRTAGKWAKVPGWYGHGDAPVPDTHWDPGALEWTKVFAAARLNVELLVATRWTPPVAPARLCKAEGAKS